MDIERYDLQAGDGNSVYSDIDSDGEWCKYEDVSALIAEHAKAIEAAYRDGNGDGYASGLIDGINGVSSCSKDEWRDSDTYASLHKVDK